MPSGGIRTLNKIKRVGSTVRILLTHNKYTVIDKSDYDKMKQYHWYSVHKGRTWYAETIAFGIHLKFARVLLDAPKGVLTDHKDHDGLNNRRYNIRLCTHQENQRNLQKMSIKTSSKFKGVTKCADCARWRSSIRVGNKLIHLGLFKNEIDAAKSYDLAAKKHYGVFACLNFK